MNSKNKLNKLRFSRNWKTTFYSLFVDLILYWDTVDIYLHQKIKNDLAIFLLFQFIIGIQALAKGIDGTIYQIIIWLLTSFIFSILMLISYKATVKFLIKQTAL